MGAGDSKSQTDQQNSIDEVKSQTRFSSKEVKEWYEKFHQDFPDGVIHEEQFVKMYTELFPNSEAEDFAKSIFNAYDKDGNGTVDFQEFMVTLNVSSHGTPIEKLKWAFSMYDEDNDGVVTNEELVKIISAIGRMKGDFNESEVNDAALQIFLRLDRNNDGLLSEDEFIAGALESPTIMSILTTQ